MEKISALLPDGPLKEDFERERRELLEMSAKGVEMQAGLEKRGGKIEGGSSIEPKPETAPAREAQRASAAESQPKAPTDESQQAQALYHEQEKAPPQEKQQQELTEHQRFALRFLEQEARRAQDKEESEGESM